MINKIVVAAAGRGTRMLHLSKRKPKHLIKIKGKPFLYYLLKNIKQAGFTEIIIVIGYQKKAMENFLKQFSDEFNLTIINQFETLGDKYGTACPIECLKDIIKDDENFVCLYGDSLWSVKDLQKFQIDDQFNYIAGFKHPEPQKYGVLVKADKDYLEKIEEKPTKPTSDLINTGLYKFTSEIFTKIPLLSKSPRGEYELTDAINLLANEKKVKIKEVEDYWLDFGKPEDIKTISDFLNHNLNKSHASQQLTSRSAGS